MSADLSDMVAAYESAVADSTGHLRFGLEGELGPPDAHAWASAAVRFGFWMEPDWALDWIRAGYQQPPGWMFNCLPVLVPEARA